MRCSARPGDGDRASRRAVLIAAVVAIVLLLIAALTGFLVLRQSGAKQSEQAACFVKPEPRSAASSSCSRATIRVPRARNFGAGRLGPGPVPKNFAVCVLPTGGLAVIPGESGTTCQQLALPLAKSGSDAVAEMTKDLTAALQTRRCVSRAEAVATTRERLEPDGLSDWRVRVDSSRPFGGAYPCASFAIDTDKRIVSILAIPSRTP